MSYGSVKKQKWNFLLQLFIWKVISRIIILSPILFYKLPIYMLDTNLLAFRILNGFLQISQLAVRSFVFSCSHLWRHSICIYPNPPWQSHTLYIAPSLSKQIRQLISSFWSPDAILSMDCVLFILFYITTDRCVRSSYTFWDSWAVVLIWFKFQIIQ